MTSFTRILRPLGICLIFLFAVCCIFGSIFVRDIDTSRILGTFLEYTVSFEDRFYDFRLKRHLDRKFVSQDLVLVKIDDYSLQKIGSWPLPRTVYATLLDKLKGFGTKVVAFDIMFPEKSPDLGTVSPDQIFAESIRNFQGNGGRVFLGYNLAGSHDEALPEAPVEMLNDAIQTRNVPNSDMEAEKIAKYTFPIPQFLETEVGVGHISSVEDSDGVFREYKLIANIDTIYFGSLSFNAFEAFTGNKHTVRIFADGTGELDLKDSGLEISRQGETKVRYKGGEDQFPSVSLFDLISSKDGDPTLKKLMQNKLVFVGSVATGAHDLRPSPIDSKMPGVYSHINMAHMLLHRYFFKSSNDSVKYSLLILLVGMFIFVVVQRFRNAILDALTIAAIIASAYYIDSYYFMREGYELKLFYCFFCFVTCYSWNTFLQFYETNREKKQIRGTFARYVAPTIVDEMLKNPQNLHVGGVKKDITCLFSDVRDFTSISEGLTATELAHSLNIYMGKMTDIVFETKGTLDKYIGDAIVALWGAPLEIGNHAQFAVEGALRMMEVLPSINEEFRKLGRPEFHVGVGLNSGECSVGNMGSERIFSYTALGDNMNLGARLEGLCKYYGTQILISEYTLERLDKEKIKTRPIDKVIVKGKTLPVAIFEVLHAHHPMTKDPEALNFYLTAHGLFGKKKFREALEVFQQILLALPEDKPTKRLVKLCQKFLEHPESVDEDFDVTKMTEK